MIFSMVIQITWLLTWFSRRHEQQLYYLTYCSGNNRVHAFPKSVSPKVNVLAQLGFELVYWRIGVQHISRYALGTPFHQLQGIFDQIQRDVLRMFSRLWFSISPCWRGLDYVDFIPCREIRIRPPQKRDLWYDTKLRQMAKFRFWRSRESWVHIYCY